jgi:hypothetical protein
MSFYRVPFGFRWILVLLCGFAFLFGLLFWVFRFDLEVSPSWQVLAYYLMLLLFLLSALGLVAPDGFGRMGWFGWMMAVLLPVVLVSVLVIGWLHGGPYEGYRDPRLFPLAVVSVALFAIIHLFFFGFTILVRTVLNYVYPGFERRRLGSSEPGSFH